MKALRRNFRRTYLPDVRPYDARPNRYYTDSFVNATQRTQPPRKLTQEQQYHEDEEERKEAMKDLVESWMDRLQLISVITTFFASTEASLLSITTHDSPNDSLPALEQVANAGLIGSLVMHTNAAIISFLAAFFLISYKLKVAKNEERQVEQTKQAKVESPTSIFPKEMETTNQQSHGMHGAAYPTGISHEPFEGSPAAEAPVWTSDPHLVQVGPFQGQPPTHLLARCHALCIFLSAIGFALALMGILCFTWARHPPSVSIFGTICMSFCVLFGVTFLLVPNASEGSRRSLIYYHEGSDS